jgi:DNA mismatch repair ATPase MutS
MIFNSILFKRKTELVPEQPSCFINLNLNQVIDTIVLGKEEYNLKPFFYTPLTDTDAIIYRQQIMQDIENSMLFDYIETFAKNMRDMRIALSKADKCSYKYEKERLFLDSLENYCDAINSLAHNLSLVDIKSPGFVSFHQYLTGYIQSIRFTSLFAETKKLITDLSAVQYCIHLKDLRVQVRPYNSETDYSEEVDHIFEKFKQEPVKDYLTKFENFPGMNHVEAAILDGVATLYPDMFQNLDDYYAKNTHYLDETISVFDREIQFYTAWLGYISKLKKTGLQFCYPQVSNTSKEVYNYESFDVALAYKLVKENASIVCNDFCMAGKERIIIVSGPNQGGKTTFARTFGQLHYLAAIGCSVPGSKAKLFLPDKIFTHFEKEENISDHRSKFEDDLFRIHDILNQATPSGIIIMNEILSSTTLQDSIFLSKKIMEKIDSMDVLCVWVTFIDELILLSKKTISMVSTIVPENPAVRTFKVIKKPANGLAYALSIAEKYKVTYRHLKERIQ